MAPLNVLEKLIASLLVLVGLAFLALLAFLRFHGELAGDVEASAFMVCAGAILIYIGIKWLLLKEQTGEPVYHDRNDRYLLKLRRSAEFCAAACLVLHIMRATALLCGVDWLPGIPLWPLASAPILIGLFTQRILVPGASQSGLFSYDVVSRWPKFAQTLLPILVRAGVLGYPAAVLVWPGGPGWWAWTRGGHVQAVASICIALFCASQVVILHYGRIREPESESTPQ